MAETHAFNDKNVQRLVHQKRDQFIKHLRDREPEILQLASTTCHRGPCHFFTSNTLGNYFIRGSYNLSFFIQFSGGEKCVFRIPLRPCLAYSAQHKLQSEVATMQHLIEKTTIPIPRILGYRVDAGTDPLTTFLILEYIDGKHLRAAELETIAPHEKLNLLSSLADIYVQLRRQEFPTIGRLNGSTSEPSVGQKTVSIEMNMLQLEGSTPFSLQDTYHNEHGVLRSATSYTNMLLCIGYNAFVKSSDAVEDGMGLEAVYNYSLFFKHAKKWIDPTLDQGAFVLVHGDLHLSNLVVDDDLRIIGVLDWEWSRVVPPQYFTLPLWLSGYGAVQLAHHISWQLFRETALAEFLAIIKTREQALCGNTQLHDEWLQTVNHGEPLVANAVENWTEVDWFVHRGLHKKQAPSEEALSAFVEEDPSRALLAHIKEHDHDRSTKELVHSKVDERRKKLHESKVWRIMERISHLPRQASAAANIIGWSVAACLVIAAFWRRA